MFKDISHFSVDKYISNRHANFTIFEIAIRSPKSDGILYVPSDLDNSKFKFEKMNKINDNIYKEIEYYAKSCYLLDNMRSIVTRVGYCKLQYDLFVDVIVSGISNSKTTGLNMYTNINFVAVYTTSYKKSNHSCLLNIIHSSDIDDISKTKFEEIALRLGIPMIDSTRIIFDNRILNINLLIKNRYIKI